MTSREGSTASAFRDCTDLLARVVGTVRVVAAPDPATPDLPVSYARLLAAALHGEDPTREWRARHRELTARTSGRCPPGLDRTMVLSFVADAVATPAATAAALGPWVLDVSPTQVSVGLAEPWTYPAVVQLRPGAFAVEPDPVRRRERARAAYEAVLVPFARAYAPGERLSSRQRLGTVADLWDLAWARATGGGAVARQACCLLYALPGAVECAGCPRRRRSAHAEDSKPTVA